MRVGDGGNIPPEVRRRSLILSSGEITPFELTLATSVLILRPEPCYWPMATASLRWQDEARPRWATRSNGGLHPDRGHDCAGRFCCRVGRLGAQRGGGRAPDQAFIEERYPGYLGGGEPAEPDAYSGQESDEHYPAPGDQPVQP